MFMGEKIWAEWASISKLLMHASRISILEKKPETVEKGKVA